MATVARLFTHSFVAGLLFAQSFVGAAESSGSLLRRPHRRRGNIFALVLSGFESATKDEAASVGQCVSIVSELLPNLRRDYTSEQVPTILRHECDAYKNHLDFRHLNASKQQAVWSCKFFAGTLVGEFRGRQNYKAWCASVFAYLNSTILDERDVMGEFERNRNEQDSIRRQLDVLKGDLNSVHLRKIWVRRKARSMNATGNSTLIRQEFDALASLCCPVQCRRCDVNATSQNTTDEERTVAVEAKETGNNPAPVSLTGRQVDNERENDADEEEEEEEEQEEDDDEDSDEDEHEDKEEGEDTESEEDDKEDDGGDDVSSSLLQRGRATWHRKQNRVDVLRLVIGELQRIPEESKFVPRCSMVLNKTLPELRKEYTLQQVPDVLTHSCDIYSTAEDFKYGNITVSHAQWYCKHFAWRLAAELRGKHNYQRWCGEAFEFFRKDASKENRTQLATERLSLKRQLDHYMRKLAKTRSEAKLPCCPEPCRVCATGRLDILG